MFVNLLYCRLCNTDTAIIHIRSILLGPHEIRILDLDVGNVEGVHHQELGLSGSDKRPRTFVPSRSVLPTLACAAWYMYVPASSSARLVDVSFLYLNVTGT